MTQVDPRTARSRARVETRSPVKSERSRARSRLISHGASAIRGFRSLAVATPTSVSSREPRTEVAASGRHRHDVRHERRRDGQQGPAGTGRATRCTRPGTRTRPRRAAPPAPAARLGLGHPSRQPTPRGQPRSRRRASRLPARSTRRPRPHGRVHLATRNALLKDVAAWIADVQRPPASAAPEHGLPSSAIEDDRATAEGSCPASAPIARARSGVTPAPDGRRRTRLRLTSMPSVATRRDRDQGPGQPGEVEHPVADPEGRR